MADPIAAFLSDLERAAKDDDQVRIAAARIGVLNHLGKVTQVAQDAIEILAKNGLETSAAMLRKRLK